MDDDLIAEKADDLPPNMVKVVGRAFQEGVTAFEPRPAGSADPAPLAVAIPLYAAGRTIAVLALARSGSGRQFTLADLAAADALASRAASALENARLYQEIHQADRQKNEFLSMLAHELRNPLAPIRNSATILRTAGNDPEKLQWAAGVIDRQVGHMVRLVDDLLDISHQPGQDPPALRVRRIGGCDFSSGGGQQARDREPRSRTEYRRAARTIARRRRPRSPRTGRDQSAQ